jgi:hypothetical protein
MPQTLPETHHYSTIEDGTETASTHAFCPSRNLPEANAHTLFLSHVNITRNLQQKAIKILQITNDSIVLTFAWRSQDSQVKIKKHV